QALRDGYLQVVKELYQPEAFFGRLDDLYLTYKTPFFPGMRHYYRGHPWRHFEEIVKDVSRAAGLFARLMWRVPEATLRREYRRRLVGMLRERPDPRLLFIYTVNC